MVVNVLEQYKMQYQTFWPVKRRGGKSMSSVNTFSFHLKTWEVKNSACDREKYSDLYILGDHLVLGRFSVTIPTLSTNALGYGAFLSPFMQISYISC